MLPVTRILGDRHEERFAGRAVERLTVDRTEAFRRRLRRSTDRGTDVAIDLEDDSPLQHGAVLSDDGVRVIAVERPFEEALVIRLRPTTAAARHLRQAVAIGHFFGNRHMHVETEGGEIFIPLLGSRDAMEQLLRALDLDGAELTFRRVRLKGASMPADHHPGG
jgi:urease accessory protein